MSDSKIIDLFFARSEDAIKETKKKYGRYLFAIAKNMLGNAEDAEECESTAYLDAWNTIPPQRPQSLKSYLSTLVRRSALDCFDKRTAKKRGGGQCGPVYEEIEEFLDANSEDPADVLALREAINGFLGDLPSRDRVIFVQRYYYLMPIREIAADNRLSEGAVKMKLSRLRGKLALHLKTNGFEL